MKLETALVTPSNDGIYVIDVPHHPTKSPVPKRHWLWQMTCRHKWKYLYRDDIMFFQEMIGRAYHHACTKCGEIRVDERDS